MSFSPADKKDDLQHLKVRVAEGEESAFRKLFDLFFAHLTQFAFSLVKSKEAATDLVDEVFIRIWNNRATILMIENMKVYLYKATKNAALNYLSRKAQKQIHEPFDDIQIQLKDEHNPESLMITNEILIKIREAVDALPPRCKMIFKLIREDGLKYREVADILNISVKTVDAQMVIAVGQIKEKLKSHLQMPSRKNFQKN